MEMEYIDNVPRQGQCQHCSARKMDCIPIVTIHSRKGEVRAEHHVVRSSGRSLVAACRLMQEVPKRGVSVG